MPWNDRFGPKRSLAILRPIRIVDAPKQRKHILMGLVSELRRRNVHCMAVLYLAAAWLVMQVAEVVIELARRKAGDEQGAQAAAQIARLDHAARRAAGRKNWNQDLAEAMIAAFDNDPEGVITALKSALQRGLRFSLVFDNPIFEDLQDEPRFTALRHELDAILAVEHDKVLQLTCFHNPVPDYWQPLPETCAGVVKNLAN